MGDENVKMRAVNCTSPLRGRLARWFVTLQNYEVNFEYIPGKKNTAADALL